METGLQIAPEGKGAARGTSRCLVVGIWIFVALQLTLMCGVVFFLRTSSMAIVEAQASIARMEAAATSARVEFQSVGATVQRASKTFHELVDSEAGAPKVVEGALSAAWTYLCPRVAGQGYAGENFCVESKTVAQGVIKALVRANEDAGAANLTLVDALAAAPFVDLRPLFAGTTTVGKILASLTAASQSHRSGKKYFDLTGPMLANVGGALQQLETILSPVNAQLLAKAPKDAADDAKSLTKMIEGVAAWVAPLGSATSIPALGKVCSDVIDVIEAVPLQHAYTLDVAAPANYDWDKCGNGDTSGLPCKYPDCAGADCFKTYGWDQDTGPFNGPRLACHYTAATAVACTLNLGFLPDPQVWTAVRAYCAEVAAYKQQP